MKPAIARLLDNARRLGHQTQTAAFAIELVTKERAVSLCSHCAEHVEGDACRLPRGGECSRCPYVGRDCLVVIPPDVLGNLKATIARIEAETEALVSEHWPKSRDFGNLAVEPTRSVGLTCPGCQVSWQGCAAAADCPVCGNGVDWAPPPAMWVKP